MNRKIVIFAHIPPPYHGQSIMVQLMLEGLRSNVLGNGTPSIEVHHINARFSCDLSQIGSWEVKKLWLLLIYCLQAIGQRIRYGVRSLYYIPAPVKPIPILRDCLVLALLRPFFPVLIYQHRAMGLGHWLKAKDGNLLVRMGRWVCYFLLGHPNLSLVLSSFGRDEAEGFAPQKIVVVENGRPDPCPNFTQTLLPHRTIRWKKILDVLNKNAETASLSVLFLGHCTKEKGVFDAMQTCQTLARWFAQQSFSLSMTLNLAGAFFCDKEKEELIEWIAANQAEDDRHGLSIQILGFVEGSEKDALLRKSDVLLFPSYYQGEATPGVLIEALAYGMEVVTTNWREIYRMLPPSMQFEVKPRDIEGLVAGLRKRIEHPDPAVAREHFLSRFSIERFWKEMQKSLAQVIPE